MNDVRKGVVILAILMGFSSFFWTRGETKSFVISATVPQATDVDITLSKIDSKGTVDSTDDVWLGQATAMSFGDLTPKTVGEKIILVPKDNVYYAADVGVDGAGPWTIHHKVSGADFLGEGSDSLGDNIVVTFVKQINDTTAEDLDKCAIKNSNGKSFTSAQLEGGWLRIYYGIAIGAPGEPSDVKPITPTEVARTYTGTVEITLTVP